MKVRCGAGGYDANLRDKGAIWRMRANQVISHSAFHGLKISLDVRVISFGLYGAFHTNAAETGGGGQEVQLLTQVKKNYSRNKL